MAVAIEAFPLARTWLSATQHRVERELEALFDLPDESGLDPRWDRAMREAKAYALRPAKRLRPALLLAGYGLAAGTLETSPGLWRFAAGFELIHTFMLIHDDVADEAQLRRGGVALHRQLGSGKAGEDLAVVVGDHLFARSIEAMLESGLPRASAAVHSYLGVCRHTAAGQYLDLSLARTPLAQVTLFQALKVAHLKTARYGFVAPLVCGARLGRGDARVLAVLERVGRHVGLAYQLRDDVLGLFGDSDVCGKNGDSDFAQKKRTFPVLAAYGRASAETRARLDELWNERPTTAADPQALSEARNLVELAGGRAATERVIARLTRSAEHALTSLPAHNPVRELLSGLVAKLAGRSA